MCGLFANILKKPQRLYISHHAYLDPTPTPTPNPNPNQELSRRDAELHLAYAVQAFADGRVVEAERQWTSGCVRLEAYVQARGGQ